MNKEAEFAVKILHQYAKENSVIPRSTSDLSPLEGWLIKNLLNINNDKLNDFINFNKHLKIHYDYFIDNDTYCLKTTGEEMDINEIYKHWITVVKNRET